MHPGSLQHSLQFLWRTSHLHVVLSGKAVAPPPSALMYAAVKRTMSDISDGPYTAGSALPQTPTGQKVVKSQRVGGISPGHPTFEAAMRNSTANTPSRRQAGDTPGLSRYALEAASNTPQAASFADRLKDLANSPEPAPPARPRVRLKRTAGTAPLRSLRLSVNQQLDTVPATAAMIKPAAALGKTAELAGRAGGVRKAGTVSTKGFSFFHSGYHLLHICCGAGQEAWLKGFLQRMVYGVR